MERSAEAIRPRHHRRHTHGQRARLHYWRARQPFSPQLTRWVVSLAVHDGTAVPFARPP